MRRKWAGVAVAVLMAAAAGRGQEPGSVVGGFRVPQYDENNIKKSELFGETARILPNGVVDVTNLRMDFFRDGTNLQMRVRSPRCRYDQRRNVARSEHAVRIDSEYMTVTGENFSYDGRAEVFKIESNARVVLRRAARARMREGTDGKADHEPDDAR